MRSWLHEFEAWDLVPIVFFALIGLLWALLAHWVGLTREPPLPTTDLGGVARAVLLWPYWTMWLVFPILAQLGWSDTILIWLVPEMFGSLVGAIAGVSLVLYSHRSL